MIAGYGVGSGVAVAIPVAPVAILHGDGIDCRPVCMVAIRFTEFEVEKFADLGVGAGKYAILAGRLRVLAVRRVVLLKRSTDQFDCTLTIIVTLIALQCGYDHENEEQDTPYDRQHNEYFDNGKAGRHDTGIRVFAAPIRRTDKAWGCDSSKRYFHGLNCSCFIKAQSGAVDEGRLYEANTCYGGEEYRVGSRQ